MVYQNVSEFILLGFSLGRPSELLLAFLFLAMYVASLGTNTIILYVVLGDSRLHTPMYFFLGNFSILDIFFISVISPQLLWNLLSGNKSISFSGCLTQGYFYFFLGTVQFLLLASMSYDRYAAICNPLQYHAIMSSQVCIQMVLGCWVGAFFSVLVPTIMIVRLSYCKSNIINHFFCDSTPLLNLSCSDTHLVELITFVQSSVIITCSLVLTVVSYLCIISAVMRITTTSGRAKVFDTCATHLTMISVACGVNIFIYIMPSQKEDPDAHKIPVLLTSVVCPFLNPFLFVLKNDLVKQVIRDMMKKNTKLTAHTFWGVCHNKQGDRKEM